MEQMNNLEKAIAEVVANYIHGHCYRTGAVDGSGVACYPERFVHVSNNESVLLAFPDDTSRSCYGRLTYAREWLHVELLVGGVHFDVKHPLPHDEFGTCDFRLTNNTNTPEGLLTFFQEVRGGKTHPLFSMTNGLRVLRSSTISVGSTDRIATWCTHGRPVATLNKWLKRFGVPTLGTTQGNELLAAIDDVLQDQKAQCAWAGGSIGRFYSSHASVPYSSCMAGADESWFGLYDHMQSNGKLRLLNITRDDEHIGRALVWFGSNPDDLYLDRVYAPPYRDSFEPDVIKAIKEFCATEGIQKTVYAQTAERIGLQHVGGFSIATDADPSDFHYYPYVDSLRYFGHDGRLRTQNSHSCIVLDQTNGGPHYGEDEDYGWDEDYVTLPDGRHALLDDCTELDGGTYVLTSEQSN